MFKNMFKKHHLRWIFKCYVWLPEDIPGFFSQFFLVNVRNQMCLQIASRFGRISHGESWCGPPQSGTWCSKTSSFDILNLHISPGGSLLLLVNISKPWQIKDDMVMYGHVCHFQPWSLKILLFGHQSQQWKSPIDQMFLNVSFMGHQPQAVVGRLN